MEVKEVNVEKLMCDYLRHFRCGYCKHDCDPSKTHYKIAEKYDGWQCRGFYSVYRGRNN